MQTKAKISLVIPNNLQRDLRAQIVKDGYDMREKSKWIVEGIERLLNMQNYPELVFIGNEMKGFEKLESVVMPRDLKRSLDKAALTVKQRYPELDGVQSSIVRTAIVQRLIQS